MSALGLAMLAGGCAGRDRQEEPAGPAASAEGAVAPDLTGEDGPESFQALHAFDGKTGERLSWEEVVGRCADASAVLIGEEHDLTPAQIMAADLFAAIVERRPGAALSLEFFERDEQVHLDDYIGGLTTREQFEAATGRREGNYPAGHAAMIEVARRAGVPVIASNAPRRYVRLARLEGYDRLRSMSGTQRSMFAIPTTMPTGRYRQTFIEMMSQMGAHGPTGADAGPVPSEADRIREAEATFRSQAMWDATMAESVARAIADGHRPVVHVIGRFHTDFDGGTVQMLRRARSSARVVTLTCTTTDSDSLRDEDRGIADVVMYLPQAAETAEEGTPQA